MAPNCHKDSSEIHAQRNSDGSKYEPLLWKDEILHPIEKPGMMIPLQLPTNNGCPCGANGFRSSTVWFAFELNQLFANWVPPCPWRVLRSAKSRAPATERANAGSPDKALASGSRAWYHIPSPQTWTPTSPTSGPFQRKLNCRYPSHASGEGRCVQRAWAYQYL